MCIRMCWCVYDYKNNKIGGEFSVFISFFSATLCVFCVFWCCDDVCDVCTERWIEIAKDGSCIQKIRNLEEMASCCVHNIFVEKNVCLQFEQIFHSLFTYTTFVCALLFEKMDQSSTVKCDEVSCCSWMFFFLVWKDSLNLSKKNTRKYVMVFPHS